jgi:hypothetical protein
LPCVATRNGGGRDPGGWNTPLWSLLHLDGRSNGPDSINRLVTYMDNWNVRTVVNYDYIGRIWPQVYLVILHIKLVTLCRKYCRLEYIGRPKLTNYIINVYLENKSPWESEALEFNCLWTLVKKNAFKFYWNSLSCLWGVTDKTTVPFVL